MVITLLEAEVDPAGEASLRSEYAATGAGPLPPFILRAMLLRRAEDPRLWSIMTVFRTWEDLEAMRASGQIPRGVQIFQAAGAQPRLSVFEIVDEFENRGDA